MNKGIIPSVTEKINTHIEQMSAQLDAQFSRSKEDQSTMLHYVKTCRSTFEEEAFNEVDSLILSWLSYLRIPEDVLPKKALNSPVTAENSIFSDTDSCLIRELLREEYYTDMLLDIWSPDETLEMLYAMALSPRFEKIRLCMRREELDHEAAKQFAAITFQISPDLTYVAFRGTDKTLTGWEEDFRLCLIDPVPSQTLAAEYLAAVGQVFRGTLITGGHSKGGNLAVYAAANCDTEVQERIREIYTHDGPGFLMEDLQKDGFKRIQSKIRKTAPQFSVFGMLMRQETEPKIIYSYEKGIMQHNAASWKTEGCGFSEYRYPDRTSQVLKNKLNNWIDGLTNEERKMFIDTVFNILDETGMEKFGDLKTNLTEITPVVIRELQKLDPSMQRFLFDLLRQLVFASKENRDPNAELQADTHQSDEASTTYDEDIEQNNSTQGDHATNNYAKGSPFASLFSRGENHSTDELTQEEIDRQNALDELNGKTSEREAEEKKKSLAELMKKYDELN